MSTGYHANEEGEARHYREAPYCFACGGPCILPLAEENSRIIKRTSRVPHPWQEWDVDERANADLVVHAVNTLPLYEELREAADALMKAWNRDDLFDFNDEVVAIGAILHRLEEEER